MGKCLAVILGAGSSHDCVTENITAIDTDYRPPLTKDLFSFHPKFNEILHKYQTAEALSERIRTRINAGESLESILRSLQCEPNRLVRRWYYGIPLYLQELLGEVSDRFVKTGATKFETLIAEIERSAYERVLYLTLNYDLFLEKALRKLYPMDLKDPSQYITSGNKWGLVKLHGSVNWGKKLANLSAGLQDHNRILEQIPDEIVFDSEVQILSGWRDESRYIEDSFYYPALTVPLEGKDEFVCPKEHSDHAEQFLRDCADFLVIGFSAVDGHVLNLIGKVNDVKKLTIVNQDRASAIQTLDRLIRVNNHFDLSPARKEDVASDVGFARFMTDGGLTRFLEI